MVRDHVSVQLLSFLVLSRPLLLLLFTLGLNISADPLRYALPEEAEGQILFSRCR